MPLCSVLILPVKVPAQAMSQWIADNTNGTLNPSFEPNPEQIMSIINTIYFRDQWFNLFDANLTKADTFTLMNGAEVTCDFMNMIIGSSNFSKGDGFTRSSLQLKSQASMVFVLPDQGVDLQSLLSSPASLQALFEGGTESSGKVTWKIPKFAYDSNFDLADTMKKLGITSAFKQDADFSGITDHQTFISSIIQNTHIAIDEKGVEASAFTKIDLAGSAQPVGQAEMILDRPFLYGIFSSGVLLFIGILRQPVIRFGDFMSIMQNKIVIITGASDGIGAAAARLLHARGASVVIVGHSEQKTKAVARELNAPYYLADFAKLVEVRQLATQLRKDYPHIDVLVNNAGGVFGNRELTVDGHEKALQVNHLAPFLLTCLLMDILIDSKAVVINTSSAASRLLSDLDINDLEIENNYSPSKAYGNSKT